MRKTRDAYLMTRPVQACCLVVGLLLAGCAPTASAKDPPLPSHGHGRVAHLPRGGGLQYCINLGPGDLAPPRSRSVYIHSLSVYVTTVDRNEPALLAITGRYPGWDTPGTTIYNQPFTNTNTVWLEIIHEFPLGISCLEVYGHGLRPSSYAVFKNRTLVSFTYRPRHGPGISATKLFPVSWGPYLAQYAPAHRPRH